MGMLGGRPMEMSRDLWELFGTGSPVGLADTNRAPGSEYWQLDGGVSGVRWYKVGATPADWSQNAAAVPFVPEVAFSAELLSIPDMAKSSIPIVPPANDTARMLFADLLTLPQEAQKITGFLPLAGGTLTGGLVGTSARFATTFALSGILTPAPLAADANNMATANGGILQIGATAARNVTGFASGTAGRLLIVTNVSAFTLTFTEQDAASTAGNRFSTGNVLGYALLSNSNVIFYYDSNSSSWRPIKL